MLFERKKTERSFESVGHEKLSSWWQLTWPRRLASGEYMAVALIRWGGIGVFVFFLFRSMSQKASDEVASCGKPNEKPTTAMGFIWPVSSSIVVLLLGGIIWLLIHSFVEEVVHMGCVSAAYIIKWCSDISIGRIARRIVGTLLAIEEGGPGVQLLLQCALSPLRLKP